MRCWSTAAIAALAGGAPAIAADPIETAYVRWIAADPGHGAAAERFGAFLRREGVFGVVPRWQLLQTATSWRDCGAAQFAVPPASEWPHIAPTLRYIRDHVVPAIGPVRIESGWRGGKLNICSGGAPRGAHPEFFALDMRPERVLTRGELHRRLCAIWRASGRGARIGLGLYGGTRFHIDTMRWRQWKTGPGGSVAACP